MIRLIFSTIILVIILLLAIANREPVQINYLIGNTAQLPLYIILVGAFLAGGIALSIIILPAWIKNKIEIRQLRRSLKDIEGDKSKNEN